MFERVGGSVTILLLYTYDRYEDLNVKCFNWYENFGALTLCRYTLKAIAHAHNARHAYYIVQNFCKFVKFFRYNFTHGIFYMGGLSYSLIVPLLEKLWAHGGNLLRSMSNCDPGSENEGIAEVVWLSRTRRFNAERITPTAYMVSTHHSINWKGAQLTSACVLTCVVGVGSMTDASAACHVWWVWLNYCDSSREIKTVKL